MGITVKEEFETNTVLLRKCDILTKCGNKDLE